ncbi:amidase domain-containing protein [Agromyces sp. G08B096]|uniref:Amidase domain-containing protein n=1 Tax=Agromyces sp. G08B096 TaxID=3156399 RepID=A0AAU7W630_9MICO
MSRPTRAPFPRRRMLLLGGALGLLLILTGAVVWAAAGPGAHAAGPSSVAADTASGAGSTAADGDPDGDDPDADGETAAQPAALAPAVAAQLAYVRAHWQDTSNDVFGYLDDTDCMNFASQSLLERGWQPDDEWWYEGSGDGYANSTAWISSTAFMEYLEARPDRATALTDAQRDLVKPGDLVQFDWDDSGDRDHTGIVTKVERRADGSISIEYAGHTDATWDRTVDEAITELHPGGVAYYWSIPE